MGWGGPGNDGKAPEASVAVLLHWLEAARLKRVEEAGAVADVLAGSRGPGHPRVEQRRPTLEGYGVPLATFLNPRSEGILSVEIGRCRIPHGGGRGEAAALPCAAAVDHPGEDCRPFHLELLG